MRPPQKLPQRSEDCHEATTVIKLAPGLALWGINWMTFGNGSEGSNDIRFRRLFDGRDEATGSILVSDWMASFVLTMEDGMLTVRPGFVRDEDKEGRPAEMPTTPEDRLLCKAMFLFFSRYRQGPPTSDLAPWPSME